MIRDAWRLAVGTLTVLPARAPGTVDRRSASGAMILAPLAALPLALGVTVVIGLTAAIPIAPPVGGVLAVGFLALGSRALHLDGLADTADGLTASYDRERSLAVMKTGTSGPAGVAAIVIVVLLQATGLATLVGDWRTAAVAGLAVCFSRTTLAWCCSTLLAPARPDGLGRSFIGTVPVPDAAVSTVVVGGLLVATAEYAGLEAWRGPVAVLLGMAVLAALLRRTVIRFGGVTGDVLGAAIELSLAAVLLVL